MSNMRLRVARSAEEWDGIVGRFAERTRFHSWQFLQDEAAVGGWRLVPLVAERDGEPVGVMPLTIERGLLRRTPPVPHPYHGPLVVPDDLPALLRALRRERRRRRMTRLSVSFPPDAAAARPDVLRAAGWSVLIDRTYVVDLRPSHGPAAAGEEVMPFIGVKRRARMRRAMRLGVVAQRVEQVDDLLIRAMSEAYRAHDGSARVTMQTIDQVNRALARGEALAVEALHEGERIGVLIGLRSGATMLGWLGAALPAGRPLDAGTLLYHEVLRQAAADGIERYDLLGHVDDGVAHFKRSMGAEAEEFVEATDSALFLTAVRRIRDARRARVLVPSATAAAAATR